MGEQFTLCCKLYCKNQWKMRGKGRGLTTHPHMQRLRKLNCYQFNLMTASWLAKGLLFFLFFYNSTTVLHLTQHCVEFHLKHSSVELLLLVSIVVIYSIYKMYVIY